MKKEIDMLNGSLWGKIILFALPIVTTSIIQQLFNSCDTMIIGRFGEEGALAAVGTNGEIAAMFVSLSAGLAVGANVLISRFIGAGEWSRVSRAISTSVMTALISGIVLLISGELSASLLLELIHTPDEIIPDAVTYLRIYLLSVPFLMLYDFGEAVFRARGDSKRPLIVLTASGAVNVLLNLLFVIVFKMNVAGVALATVIATAMSAVTVIALLLRDDSEYRFTWSRFCKADMIRIIKIGIPAALQGAVFCLANIFAQAAVNSFGADAVAGSAIAMTFEYFAYYTITSLGQSATTFVSQNSAAHQFARCRKVTGICLILSFISCAVLTIPLTIFCHEASSLFTQSAGEIEMSCRRIMLILAFEPVCTFYEIPAGALRGLGYSALPAMETIIGICLFRIVWVFTVFPNFGTLHSLYIVYPISWAVTSLLVLGSYVLKTFSAPPHRRIH